MHVLFFAVLTTHGEKPPKKLLPILYVDVPRPVELARPQAVPTAPTPPARASLAPTSARRPRSVAAARPSPAAATAPAAVSERAGHEAVDAEAVSRPAERGLVLSLPKDYKLAPEVRDIRVPGPAPSSTETTLSRGIAAAAVPDCSRKEGPVIAGYRMGGLLALPSIAAAAMRGECR